MKKKRSLAGATNALKKPFLIMKLTFILTIFSVFQSFAGIKGQTVSIDMRDAEIRKVLTKIERQGTFRFLFNSRLREMKQKVDVSFKITAAGSWFGRCRRRVCRLREFPVRRG